MVVGPGEADRYLAQVMSRARAWADQIHVVLDHDATFEEKRVVDEYADIHERASSTWAEHEGRFRTEAWHRLEDNLHLNHDDFVVCLDADEILHDYAMIRQVPANFPGKRIPVTFYEMWGQDQYRIDGLWKPWVGYVMFPFRRHGHFKDRKLACGREPTYVDLLPSAPRPVSALLHYGYAREEDRQRKHDRYMELDGGAFHNLNHLRSIVFPAQVEPWTKGGLIDVYQG